MTHDAIDQFQEALSPFLPDYKSIDIRIVATLQQIGFLFDAVRIVFEPTKGRVPHANLPRSTELVAIHAKWDVKRTQDVIEMLRKGELEADGVLIHLKRKMSVDKWVPLDTYYHQNYDRDSAQARFGMSSYCIALEASQSTNLNPTNRARLDDNLRCEKKPWDGIDDLKRMFARQSRSWGQDTSFLEVIAPLGVKFGGKMLVEKDHLEVGVRRTVGTDPNQISIACLARSEGKIDRSQRVLSRKTLKTGHGLQHHTCRVPLPRKYEWVKCMLMYRRSEVDRLELRGKEGYESSPKWRVFSEITNETEQPKPLPDGRALEAYLEVLFHLLGFYTVHYDAGNWPVKKYVPDVVAFPKQGNWCIVLECTSRDADTHDKLGKLSTRAKELSMASEGLKAYPVLFTAIAREVVTKTDREKASREGISIITADDVQQLLDAVQTRKTNEETLAIIQHLVPGEV